MAAGGFVSIMFYTPVPQSFHSNGRPPELRGKCGALAVSGCFAVVLSSAFRLSLNGRVVVVCNESPRRFAFCSCFFLRLLT